MRNSRKKGAGHDCRSFNPNRGNARAEKEGAKDGWRFLHPPNEEVRNPRTVSKQMALGMLPGTPDIIAFSPEGKPHFMVFKSENGVLDEAQREFQLWAIKANLSHSVVRSLDEAMKVFRHCGCIKELAARDAQS